MDTCRDLIRGNNRFVRIILEMIAGNERLIVKDHKAYRLTRECNEDYELRCSICNQGFVGEQYWKLEESGDKKKIKRIHDRCLYD